MDAECSYSLMNKTNTDGTSAVCFRIHIGAISPSGYNGEDGVSGESGECGACEVLRSDEGGILRGGNWTVYRI